MKSLLTITDNAAQELKKRTAMNPQALGVRLSVTNTGCSGHKYKMEHILEESPDDDKFEWEGAVLYVPRTHILFLAGLEIDYKQDGLSSGFVFNNPNAGATCGCGESFSIEKPMRP